MEERKNLIELKQTIINVKGVAHFLLIDYEQSNSSAISMFQWDDDYVDELNKICVDFINKVHKLNNDYDV